MRQRRHPCDAWEVIVSSDHWLARALVRLVAVAVIAAVLWGAANLLSWGRTGPEDSVVYRYCSYGAASSAQFNGCTDHVDEGTVNDLDTPAARYGRGESTSCGAGAGPLCRP